MDDIKRCSKCKMDCFKTNFYKDRTMKDGLRTFCNFCTDQYLYKNRDKKSYVKEIEEKQMIVFVFFCRTRSRICQALQRKTKSSSTRSILDIDIDTYKKWIEFQMTPHITWDNTEIDHMKPICLIDVSKDKN